MGQDRCRILCLHIDICHPSVGTVLLNGFPKQVHGTFSTRKRHHLQHIYACLFPYELRVTLLELFEGFPTFSNVQTPSQGKKKFQAQFSCTLEKLELKSRDGFVGDGWNGILNSDTKTMDMIQISDYL